MKQTGVLRILNGSGDTPVPWNKADAKSVEKAKEIFDDLMRRHHHAFGNKAPGEPKAKMKKFDQEAHEVVMFAQIRGG
jgi:hypothetical protein